MALPSNARLVFKIPSGVAGEDVDGNPTIQYQNLIVVATMRPDTSAKWREQGAALLPGQTRVKGNAINPKQLPVLPRISMLEITDPVTGQVVVGKFLRDLPIQSKFKAVTKALGAKITGIFDGDIGDPLIVPLPEGDVAKLKTLPAGEVLSALRIVSRSAGQYFAANPMSDASIFAIAGLTTSASIIGAPTTPINNAEYEDQSWSWVAGRPIFLGNAGILTQTPPNTGWLQVVARPLSPTAISIEIEEPIKL
jgi:hypothetical protein